MTAPKASTERKVVVLGTGGTIAGTADSATDSVGYRAASLGVDALLAAVPPLAGWPIECEQVAQVDSKDMTLELWVALAAALRRHLQRPEVCGVVITHGTDTLEETAYFLHRTLAAPKPVVLTAAMRPASALSADGPQNLVDALTLAREPGACGVLAVLCSQVLAGAELRKLHGYRVDAFGSGDAGPVAVIEERALRRFRPWPQARLHPADPAALPVPQWPLIEIVTSHAGARGATIDALVGAGAAGIVIAGTGNGSVHHELGAAAERAAAAGVRVVRASRCALGGVVGAPAGQLPSYGTLTPWQARIELLLDLLAARQR
jgi:L-asparaginase